MPFVAILGLMLVLLCAGCKKNGVEVHDPFFDQWKAMAQKSKGYSPRQESRAIEYSQAAVTPITPVKTEPTHPPLPTNPITLKLNNAELASVLRSLARAGSVNLVLSSSIASGKVSNTSASTAETQSASSNSGNRQGDSENNQRQSTQETTENTTLRPVSLNVSNAPWNSVFESLLLANGLSYKWDGPILRVLSIDDLNRENELKKAQEESIKQVVRLKEAEPLVTLQVDIQYADLDELYNTVNNYLGQSSDMAKDGGDAQQGASQQRVSGSIQGSVVADKHSNSLIIQAAQTDAEQIVKLISKLDRPRSQITLRAYIIETTKETARQLGVQWGGIFRTGLAGQNFWAAPGGTGTAATDPLSGSSTPYYGPGQSGQGYGLNFPGGINIDPTTGLGAEGMALDFLFGRIGENILELQLTALAEDGKVNILSSPSITTLENQTAYTENGRKIPYVSTSQNGTNVEFIDAVLRLEMTPHIVDGHNLRMKVLVKNDQVDENKNNWVQGNPPVIKKQTETSLIVEDGETIVISGLTKNVIQDSDSGVPFLKDVPGLGYAFKSTAKSEEMEEVLVFITPHILPQRALAHGPTVSTPDPENLMSKYSLQSTAE